MIFDAVVIGAGPAGSYLARTIAANGGKVALVDRSVFPRDKLCGGFLTDKTIKLLEVTFPDFVLSGVGIRSVHVFYKEELSASLNILSRAKVMRRYTLDTALLVDSKKHGANLYLGSPIQTIDFKKNEAVLKSGRILKYKHLIGADGALSFVRKQMGLPCNQLGFCVETHIPWETIKKTSYLRGGGAEIYYGNMPVGYGWVFPCLDSVAVGVGNMSTGENERETVAAFHSFMDKIAYPSGIKTRAAYIPSGKSITLGTSRHENAYLIGDAAGLIDPFTGEGIYYALLSAKNLGEAIFSSESTYSEYQQRMETIVATINDSCRIRDELYTPSILNNAISSLQGLPQYGEKLVDQAIVRYSKSYRDAYEEFKTYAR